ncbi:YqaJ viral recombinase family nuclease [Actinomadura rupiterrae]|uniref:YqaJ viral recombinase family nuclease n=1 Tax=Actinomadura rupiterrae TaxID=559627 RepID=UPI0020A4A5E8|nr:YqaJ viral recombinase family protein [Actinomadura rupiterrae]MCP2339223.1 putative phage-type endonuclease [Actinomadura rupiterrae]
MSVPYRLIVPASADRAVWLAERRSLIGSSDVAAILGVAPRGTPQAVYYDKRGMLPLEEDAGEAALWGSLDEETTAREWARRNRSVVRRIGLIARKDATHRGCTLDRLVTECPLDRHLPDRCALEVKHRSAWLAGKWRRSVPDDVLAQVLWQIHVTGMDHVHVACRIGGNDFRQYAVRRADHTDLIADIVTAVDRFWHEHVLAGRVPPLSGAEDPDAVLDLYDRLHPDRDGIARLDGQAAADATEALLEYETQRLAEGRAKKAKARAKARLVELLDSAEAAVLYDQTVAAYSLDAVTRDGDPLTRSNVDLDRLAELHPAAYADCVTEAPYRRLSIARERRLTEEDIDVSVSA